MGKGKCTCLSWFKYHPQNTTFGKLLTVWYSDIFEIGGICSLIPVQFIKCRTVALVDKLDGESVLFVHVLISDLCASSFSVDVLFMYDVST